MQKCFLAFLTMALAITTRIANADLEVGIAFGSNWADVEEEGRDKLIESLAKVSDECAEEASCPPDVKIFCGYDYNGQETMELNHIVEAEIRGETNVRRIFDPHCDSLHFGHECYLDLCLDVCFDKVPVLSKSCNSSIAVAREHYEALHELEEQNDKRESWLRICLFLVGILSVLESVLVIEYINIIRDEENKYGAHSLSLAFLLCAYAFLIYFTWSQPFMMVVTFVPFAVVQLVYYACTERPSLKDENYSVEDNDTAAVSLLGIAVQLV